jgi:hypothetical protein
MEMERRTRRSDNITQALRLQLAACRDAGRLAAMVLADRDGLPLAVVGDLPTCEEVAGRMALVGQRVSSYRGTVRTDDGAWPVHMRRVIVDGAGLLLCAIGGSRSERQRQIVRSSAGVERILA